MNDEQEPKNLLAHIAADVAAGQITTLEARQQAEDVVFGRFIQTSVGRQRVMYSATDFEEAMMGLMAHLTGYGNEDHRRWAAVMILVFTLLAGRSVDTVKKRLLEVFKTTGGAIPPKAEAFAREIINAAITDPDIRQDRAYCAILLRYRPRTGEDDVTR